MARMGIRGLKWQLLVIFKDWFKWDCRDQCKLLISNHLHLEKGDQQAGLGEILLDFPQESELSLHFKCLKALKH